MLIKCEVFSKNLISRLKIFSFFHNFRAENVKNDYFLIFLTQIGRIVSTLISELETPDVDLMKTLAFIAKTYGPVTSTIHKHFYVIFTALKRPMHELDYGSHVADLLSTIIESSAGLIKPEVFVTVQKAVCEVNRMETAVLKWKMRFSSIFESEIAL